MLSDPFVIGCRKWIHILFWFSHNFVKVIICYIKVQLYEKSQNANFLALMILDLVFISINTVHVLYTFCRWIFKQLYDKGLVYRGYKVRILLFVYMCMYICCVMWLSCDYQVMPFSTGCNTPLSNFEASQNYKDVQDPAGTCANHLWGYNVQ